MQEKGGGATGTHSMRRRYQHAQHANERARPTTSVITPTTTRSQSRTRDELRAFGLERLDLLVARGGQHGHRLRQLVRARLRRLRLARCNTERGHEAQKELDGGAWVGTQP